MTAHVPAKKTGEAHGAFLPGRVSDLQKAPFQSLGQAPSSYRSIKRTSIEKPQARRKGDLDAPASTPTPEEPFQTLILSLPNHHLDPPNPHLPRFLYRRENPHHRGNSISRFATRVINSLLCREGLFPTRYSTTRCATLRQKRLCVHHCFLMNSIRMARGNRRGYRTFVQKRDTKTGRWVPCPQRYEIVCPCGATVSGTGRWLARNTKFASVVRTLY